MTTARSSGAGDGPPRPSARSSRPQPSRTTAASSSTSSTDPTLVEAGRVGRAHGLDGSFLVTRPYTAALEADELTIAGAARAVVRRAGTATHVILRVEGCSSRSEAEAWRGETIWAPRTVLPPLEEDEYYVEDVEGCAVWDGDVEVGVVRRMFPLPSCHVLEVERAGGRPDLLVPLVRDAVRSVDIEARRVDISLAFLGEQA